MNAAQVYSQFRRFNRTPMAMMAFCDWCEDNGVAVPHLEVLPERYKYEPNLVELLVYIWVLTGPETQLLLSTPLPDGWLETAVALRRNNTAIDIDLKHTKAYGSSRSFNFNLRKFARHRPDTVKGKLQWIQTCARDLPRHTQANVDFFERIGPIFETWITSKL